jgi:hypothetical protein
MSPILLSHLLLPLLLVLFNLRLRLLLRLLQPPVLPLSGLGHLLARPLLRNEQLLDAGRLRSHREREREQGLRLQERERAEAEPQSKKIFSVCVQNTEQLIDHETKSGGMKKKGGTKSGGE